MISVSFGPKTVWPDVWDTIPHLPTIPHVGDLLLLRDSPESRTGKVYIVTQRCFTDRPGGLYLWLRKHERL